MTIIYKYKLDCKIGESIHLQLPHGAKILKADFQNDDIYLWAYIPCYEDKITEPRTFIVYFTGQPIDLPTSQLEYINTIQKNSFVFHVFENIT